MLEPFQEAFACASPFCQDSSTLEIDHFDTGNLCSHPLGCKVDYRCLTELSDPAPRREYF
jgi:hypothetical protein